MAQHPDGESDPLNQPRTVTKILRNMGLQKRSFGVAYAYINPWHAAMDSFIQDTEIKSAAARKRLIKRKREQAVAQRPVLRV